MTDFPESGHSKVIEISNLTGRFRPQAAVHDWKTASFFGMIHEWNWNYSQSAYGLLPSQLTTSISLWKCGPTLKSSDTYVT
jgi:hypothetical protein